MNRMLALVLTVLLAEPAVAGLIGVPEAVPPSADFVVALSVGEHGLVKHISSFSMTPKRAEAVLNEHVRLFAGEWGIDLNRPVSLVVAGQQGKMDELVVSGKVTVDLAALARTLKSTADTHRLEVKESPKGLVIAQKDALMVVKTDGAFVGGKKERVKALIDGAKAGGHALAPLAQELTTRAGENAAFAVFVSLPGGIPGPPPQNIAGQPIAGLWSRVRGVFAALKEKDLAIELTFDDPDAAKAGEPMLQGWLKTLEGAIGTQVAAAEKAARERQPVNYLDPAWVGARLSLETVKELAATLKIGVDGKRLTLAFPRDVLGVGLGNPMMATAVVGVLAAIAVPNFTAARARANHRACFANQKTLIGSIEMYRLDKNATVKELTPKLLEELKSGGYLHSIPQDPGQGPGTETNYYLTDKGIGIACRVHGSVDGAVQGTLPPPGQ